MEWRSFGDSLMVIGYSSSTIRAQPLDDRGAVGGRQSITRNVRPVSRSAPLANCDASSAENRAASFAVVLVGLFILLLAFRSA
jgi:hypothetical protein